MANKMMEKIFDRKCGEDKFSPVFSIHSDGFSYKLSKKSSLEKFYFSNYKELIIYGDFKKDTIDLVLAGSGIEEKNIVFFFNNAVVVTSTYTDIIKKEPSEKRYILKIIMFPNEDYKIIASDSLLSEVE